MSDLKRRNQQVRFIEKAKSIYGDTFDYSFVEYVDARTPVKLKCNTCGDVFEVKPRNILENRYTCKNCINKKNKEDYFTKLYEKFGDRFDYEQAKTEFVNQNSRIHIKCNKCGNTFEVDASNFLYLSKVCPICEDKQNRSQDDFIRIAKEKFGDAYDYSKVKYVDSDTPVVIICNICKKEFSAVPKRFFIEKFGCHRCEGEFRKDQNRILGDRKVTFKDSSKNNIIEKSKKIFGNKFSYIKLDEWQPDEIYLRCNDCGTEFKTSPENHYNTKNGGCNECRRRLEESKLIELIKSNFGDKFDTSMVHYIGANSPFILKCNDCGSIISVYKRSIIDSKSICKECDNRHNRDEFIKNANEKFGNLFNFDKAYLEYKNRDEYVTVKCIKCGGEFKIRPRNLIFSLKDCPLCTNIRSRNTDEFIELAKEKYGDKFDYSRVNYVNNSAKVELYCKTCQEWFSVSPREFLSGVHGCPKCAKNAAFMTVEEFKKKAKEIHGDKYNYDLITELHGTSSKVLIKCNDCGNVFEQRASSHLFGKGCPYCSRARSKMEIDFVDYIENFYQGSVITSDRTLLAPKEVDIYIPDFGVAIEMTGNFWHSERINEDNSHLYKKFVELDKKGIKLYTIYEDEWIYKNDIVKSMILNSINCNVNTVYARKTSVKEIEDHSVTNKFLNDNHIQGRVPEHYKSYGLYFNDELISVMTFTRPRETMGRKDNGVEIELSRFCNKLGYRVIGGASKLLKHFIDNNKEFSKVYSFSDNRYSNGNLYKTLGFTKVRESRPDYFYISENPTDDYPSYYKRFNKRRFRKRELESKGISIDGRTEHQIASDMGFFRLYDCGKRLWELEV